ncbi:hypothetical protein QMG83_03385 [Salinibacterium sp. G-O1]|uniref:hypothetical protein n=1 Tax=Salinibacterium sp. G-O1 TaxID=3046208 RepID=UPI0024BB7315|nr:hypothetical protein [Salinibacterium sp. G-O1]MDJ0334262.1 hypothetical protein [Salinibacterium sp. G-O1]
MNTTKKQIEALNEARERDDRAMRRLGRLAEVEAAREAVNADPRSASEKQVDLIALRRQRASRPRRDSGPAYGD